jgi:RNA polymerase sigma-70 factor (ECF subfamily)
MKDTAASGYSEATASIETLLLDVARGSRRAFEDLYLRTSATLLGVCLRVLPDRPEAEDVLQEVYIAVWNKAAQFSPQQARALIWLGTIARNRAIDRLRAQPARESQQPIELADTVHDPAPSPIAQAERATLRVRLDDCLSRLDARRRTLIRTAFFDGATYEDLATRSGSPIGSVKSWIRRGLAQLKACLES